MECPKCGMPNRSDAQFCTACSLPFAGPAYEDAAPAGPVVAGFPADGIDSVDDAPVDGDGFYRERLQEREFLEKRRLVMDSVGGPEAYEEGIRDQLITSQTRRRRRSLAFQIVLLVASLAGLALALRSALAWAVATTSPAGAGVLGVAAPSQSASIGDAFVIALVVLVCAAVLGSAAARLGRKAVWGMLAMAIALGAQVALLEPFVVIDTVTPAGSGIAFGVAVFGLATLVGGSLGAWYGAQDIAS